jgi:hypothetical protein
MGVIIILSIILVFGLAFDEKEKPSNLPSFTKQEAEQYYYNEIKPIIDNQKNKSKSKK